MPELHKLTPALGVLQDRGFRVALVTDGRMSGASGKVPAAIHLTPEAAAGGPLCRLQDGDVVSLDGEHGTLEVRVATEELMRRTAALPPPVGTTLGRELFAMYRANCTPADQGAIAYRGV
jgi:phosphogluconate dehydratase